MKSILTEQKSDIEAIKQAILSSPEIQAMRKDAKRYSYLREGNGWITAATQTGCHVDGGHLDELIDNEIADAMLVQRENISV